jgi:hypothetical protein
MTLSTILCLANSNGKKHTLPKLEENHCITHLAYGNCNCNALGMQELKHDRWESLRNDVVCQVIKGIKGPVGAAARTLQRKEVKDLQRQLQRWDSQD